MQPIPVCGKPGNVLYRRQDGIALVMVLWLVVLLTIVAASFATHSRVETRMAGNLVERQKARFMAETGFNRAVMELMAAKDEESWNLNGQVYEIQNAQGMLRIAIRSASGLVDLNKASRQILLNTFKMLAENDEDRAQLADALEDWRDSDDLRRLKGAEDTDYASEGYAYGASDRDLESVDELGYVMGFNRDAVEKLRPYVTVHSGQSSVDYQFAAESLTELLKDGMSLDSGVAEAFDQIDSDLAELEDIDDFSSPGQASGKNYRISVEALTKGGARSAIHVDIEMKNKNDKPYTILDWHHSL
ncbi:MAG: general secretion pathway protein GspK [Candidatus Thiodiazotropha sp. (ex Monitilora ramsayi)]|nr:general secretion pathway protein GspK [Candidatus Thiodiazotropha sp. (ex Monitilora ramsayi)]